MIVKAVAFVVLFGFAVPWGILQIPPLGGPPSASLRQSPEVYLAIRKSGAIVPGATVIVVGDSIANQLYPAFKDAVPSVYSLASNQAISLAGQYLLLSEFARANDLRGRTVVLVYHPKSFDNDLRNRLAFPYFVKPFYRYPEVSAFDPIVRARIAAIPWGWTALIPAVKVSGWSPDVEHVHREVRALSEVSAVYLRKFRRLADDAGFRFRIVSPFLEPGKYDYSSLQNEIKAAGLERVFQGYFESIRFLQREDFYDHVHLRKPAELGPNPLNI